LVGNFRGGTPRAERAPQTPVDGRVPTALVPAHSELIPATCEMVPMIVSSAPAQKEALDKLGSL